MSEKSKSEIAVLAALAWADGAVAPQEAAALRRLAESMDLTAAERAELDDLLREPVPLDRFEALVDALRRTHGTDEERRTMLERAVELVRADDRVDPEEERRLAVLRALLEPGGVASSLGRLRALLGAARRTVAGASDRLAGPLRAWLEPSGREESGPEGAGPALSRESRARLALIGFLARRVARASEGAAPLDASAAASALQRAAGLSPAEAAVVAAAMESDAGDDSDRQRLCAEFNRRSDERERLLALRCLFALAGASGAASPQQEAELRLIANYLWIDAQEFHRVRLAAAGEPS